MTLHRVEKTGWSEQLKVQVEVNPRKKQYVTENGKATEMVKEDERD